MLHVIRFHRAKFYFHILQEAWNYLLPTYFGVILDYNIFGNDLLDVLESLSNVAK
jgi:hypothetical protein